MNLTRKKYIRRNKGNIIVGSMILILLVIGSYFKCIKVDYNLASGDHFNILTINSILAGFLFTALGTLASSIDRPRIARLNSAGYLDDYFNGIYLALLLNIISMVSSVFIIMNILSQFKKFFVWIEQIGLIIGIAFFIKSILKLFKIIKKMREE